MSSFLKLLRRRPVSQTGDPKKDVPSLTTFVNRELLPFLAEIIQLNGTIGATGPTGPAGTNGATGATGPAGPGMFLRRTLYTTGTAATHTCGSDAEIVRLIGGGSGGAGGGCNAGAAAAAVGGGASAGGVFDVIRTLSAGFDITYTIGAAATGVLGTSGNNGNATTAVYNGETFTGNGGLGSVSSTSGTTIQLIGCVQGGTATTSGTPAADDKYIKGGPGGIAVRETASSGCGGNGGSSAEAPGGTGASAGQGTNASADGNPGQFSSGGGGAVNFNNSPVNGNTGGNGGGGFLWVYELGTS